MHPGAQRWPQTERVWRQFALFDLVMARMKVDPVLAARKDAGAAMAMARDRCLACPVQEQCRRALEEGGDIAGVMALCPDAGFFRDCRRGPAPPAS